MRRYRLAYGHDYRRCHTLRDAVGFPAQRLSWPTVLMEDEGELVGFLSTAPSQKAIIAGPLIVDPTRGSAWVTIRLIEAYERLLRDAGIHTYLFFVEDVNRGWQCLVRKCLECAALEDYAKTDGKTWYIRRLNHGW